MKDRQEKPDRNSKPETLVNEKNELPISGDDSCSYQAHGETSYNDEESTASGHFCSGLHLNGFHFIENILDTMVNPVSYKDENGVFRLVNEVHARKVLGFPKEGIIGRTISELAKEVFDKGDRRYIVEKKNLLEGCNEWTGIEVEILNHGGSRTEEQEFIVADGTTKTFILNKSALKDENGEIAGIVTVMQDITELRQMEKALKENIQAKDQLNEQLLKTEESYRAVIEKTGQMVYDYDNQSDVITWSGSIENITGYPAEYFKNSRAAFWIGHVHPEDRKRVLEGFESLDKGKDFQMELRFRKKDCTYIDLEWNTASIRDENGRVLRNLGVVKDVTEQKLAGINLQRSEERFRKVAEQTGQVIFDLNYKKHKIEWAGAIQEVTGYSPEEFKLFDESVWLENVYPEDRHELFSALKKSFEEGKRFKVEFRFRKKDGSYIHVENSGVWLQDDEGRTYRTMGVMKDVTDQKSAMEIIEASERKYRSFMQNFHGITFQTDENFSPVFFHGAVKEITGYSEEEILHRMEWTDIIHPSDLPRVFKEQEKVWNSQEMLSGDIDCRIIRRDGTVRWVNLIYQKVQGENEKPKFLQGIIYDITERKETEKYLANLEAARQKEIHHRIKNNLQVISSLLDLQAERLASMKTVRLEDVLDAFKESQNRVSSIALIHEELYQNKKSNTLNFSSYLRKLTENLFQTYKIGSADISLKLDVEENTSLDMDTAVPLGIIINELVSNSLKHAFPGRKTGEIRINLCGSETWRARKDHKQRKITGFTLEISDNGIGIPESYEIGNSETLGLQLVSILMDQLEGEIELRRKGGTDFILRFNVEKKS
ncbi:MAG: PAS domain-containing protein [Methanosarcina mazei]